MFSSLFFAFLVLALLNFVPDMPIAAWISSPMLAFEVGLFLYILFLGFIYLQIRLFSKFTRFSYDSAITFANIELLIFLILYHFGLGAHRLLSEGPLLSTLQTPLSFFSIFLYLIGLGWVHYWSSFFGLAKVHSPLHYAGTQLQFIAPFCLPFIFFSLFFDSLTLIPQWASFVKQAESSTFHMWVLIALSILLLLPTIILMPPLIVACWGCKSLPPSALSSKLQKICQQAHFKHAGFKIWSVMRYSFTAGIIGVVPRFRYIMFTTSLINEFSPEEIEAILIHEIGHSRYKHLLFYPLILLGMLIAATLLSFLYIEPLFQYFASKNVIYPSKIWNFLFSLCVFILYSISLALYFRLIFGFYSRLFERQADLHIFEFFQSPTYMIESLDHIGIVTGNTHEQPSWHHYSIQNRIDFLRLATVNPQLIYQHHHKVKKWVIVYFILLILSCLALALLIS